MDMAKACTERKNRWRRDESKMKRKERVINGYIQIKYPGIYKEAEGFHNKLKEKYPNKLDLRKTNEYDLLRTTTKRVYNHATAGVVYRKTRKIVEDNMQLKIHLLPPEATTETPTPSEGSEATTETPTPSEGSEATTETPTPNEGPEPTSDEMVNYDLAIQPVETTIGQVDTLDTPIPDDVMDQILHSLREDPFLDSYFDENW